MYYYFMNNSLKQKLFQLFTMGYQGETPPAEIFELIKNNLGGLIFFADNLKNRKFFTKTIKIFKEQAPTPLFLSIDQEGGLVERTIFLDKKIEYLTPKSLSNLSKKEIQKHYEILAKDISSLGLNLNFAPVTDVNTNPKNPIIGIRSFGNTPQTVNDCVKIVIDSFRKHNVISCTKHYPGHGDTTTDSHKIMPSIDMNFEDFFNSHLSCFKSAILNSVDTIMVSHIHFSFFDKDATPASLSQNAINYLKNELNFKGIIFSDDMVMGGISQNYGLKESIILALNAGIDNLIFRNATPELIDAIEEISKTSDKNLIEKINTAYEKTILFKQKKLGQKSKGEFDIKIEAKTIEKIALNVPQIIKNNNILPIKNKENITIIAFDHSKIYNLSYLKTNWQKYFPNNTITEIIYPLNPTEQDIKKIVKKLNYKDKIIFFSYNSILNKGQINLFSELKAPKIIVHCGLEEKIPDFDIADSIIYLHCYKTPALKALANKLQKI